ncbi:hypothetical protein [Algoriphagus sp.]|uniref:hypothetical protein n=1 Tax=Algoriphagus sp. TaxID=1872435 RepID=UPI00328EA26B
MKRAIPILLILTLNSCYLLGENGIKVAIKNKSNEPITNLEFSTTENLEVIRIDRIEPKEQINDFLSMEKNKLDGGYTLTYTRANGETELLQAGYYTVGGSLDQSIKFTIEADTTMIVFSDYY